MPSEERIIICFRDVLAAAFLIEAWVLEAGGADQAIADSKTCSAIERQLLIISEAAIRLHKLDSTAARRLAPNIDWAGVRGIGNFIRHRYDDLDAEIISDVLRNRIGELRQECSHALATLRAD